TEDGADRTTRHRTHRQTRHHTDVFLLGRSWLLRGDRGSARPVAVLRIRRQRTHAGRDKGQSQRTRPHLVRESVHESLLLLAWFVSELVVPSWLQVHRDAEAWP